MRCPRIASLALIALAACGSPAGDGEPLQAQPGATADKQVSQRAGERAARWETHRRSGAVMGTSMDLTLRLPSGQGLRAQARLPRLQQMAGLLLQRRDHRPPQDHRRVQIGVAAVTEAEA